MLTLCIWTIFLEIQRPKPEPPVGIEFNIIPIHMHTERIEKKQLQYVTSSLQLVPIELDKLAEDLLLVFLGETHSSVDYLQTEDSHRLHTKLITEILKFFFKKN